MARETQRQRADRLEQELARALARTVADGDELAALRRQVADEQTRVESARRECGRLRLEVERLREMLSEALEALEDATDLEDDDAEELDP